MSMCHPRWADFESSSGEPVLRINRAEVLPSGTLGKAGRDWRMVGYLLAVISVLVFDRDEFELSSGKTSVWITHIHTESGCQRPSRSVTHDTSGRVTHER